MKKYFLLLALLTPFAYAAEDTFQFDPSQVGKYQTGFVAKKELTFEQHKANAEFEQRAEAEAWAFDWDASAIGTFPLLTKLPPRSNGKKAISLGGTDPFKSVSLNDTGMPRAPILDQGQCGSCVPSSFTGGAADLLLQRGLDVPILSIGALMWCSHGGQCSGADGETIAKDLVSLNGLPSNDDLPYRAQNGRCPSTKGMKLWGTFDDWETLDGSVRSIAAAIANRQPVMCGVAADNSFQSYRSGVYNPSSFSMSTNHYVKVAGVDCGSAVDSSGFCQVDSTGNLPSGVGTFEVDNSWGTRYGNAGRITMQITNKSGRRTNNICGGGGNSQIITTKIPIPPSEPVVFTMENDQLTISVTVQPKAKFTVDQAKAIYKQAMDSLAGT